MVAAGQVGRRSKREMLFSSLWEGADSVLCLGFGTIFFSKGYQIERFIFSGTSIKRIGCGKVQKLRVFGLARGWIAGRFFAYFEKSTWWRHLLPSHALESIDCRKISVRRKGTVVKWIGQ